jgi:membrane protease YdiL (CAAX protease family)
MTDFLQFAARGRNTWWRYLASAVLACALAFLALLAASMVLMALRLLPPDLPRQMSQPSNPTLFFASIAASFGALAGGLMAATALIQGKRPGDLIGRWDTRLFVLGLAGWLAVQAVLTLIDVAIAPHGFALSAGPGTAALAAGALVGLAVQTFAEEYIFRGFITQGMMLLFKRPWPAALLSGLLFGSLHILNGVPQAINALVFGIVCSLIAIRTGGIALTYGIHLANNYFGAVVVVSAGDVFRGSPGIFTQDTPGLIWWDLAVAIVTLVALGQFVLSRRVPGG